MALTFHTLPYLIIPTHSYRTLSLTLFHPNDFFPCPRLPNNIYPPLLYLALPYPIPSYQIPSLPHPIRILNTILHLYKILLPYTNLSYHIEIEPNRPTAETSRIGTPSKFTQAEKSRPKWPKLCCLHSQNAEIIWTGLQSHSSAKNRFCFFWREFTGKSEAVHTPLKCKQSRYASKQDIIGYQENVLRTWYAHFQK